MDDQRLHSRDKPHPARRGIKKPLARGASSARNSSAGLLVFDERARREFENDPSPMRIFDHETMKYLAVNDAAVKFYGYTREEFLALTLKDTRHPDEHAAQLATLEESTGYLRHGKARRHIKKSGEIVMVEVVTQDILFQGRKARLSLNIDVTERKQAEDEVLRRKNLFAAVIDNLPVGVFIRDAKTLRYVLRNRSCEKSTGYAVETSAGKTAHDLFPKEQADLTVATDQKTLESGQMVEIPEQEMLGSSGKQRLYHVRKVPVYDEAGRPWMLVGIADDITERKRAEQALRESNEFLRSVIESSRDCIKVLDLEGRLLWMSVGGQRLMEIDKASSLLGRSYLDFWSAGDRDAARKALAAARAGNMSRFEGYCPTTKGSPKWWDEIVTPILDKDGRPEKLLVASRDVTEYKRAENAVRESEERFRQLAENIRQVFWINTPSGDRIDYISPGYEEIWGRSRESLYRDPRSWMESIHPDDLPAVRSGQDAMARGEHTDVEYRIIRPDGNVRWIMDRSYPMMRNDGTRLVCGIAEDVTGQKRAEQERLAHAVEQRDALVREVHHRIKNSLQGVAGLLRQKISKYPAIAPGLEEAVAQLQSVALVYGLQETRPDGLLSLAEIANAICSSAESLIGGRVERAFELKSQRLACVAGADAVSVAVALNELVFNALKHQPAKAGEKHARVVLRETADEAEIRITNHGRLPAGFDYPGGRATGSGLGLVRTLLASPGGTIAFNGGKDEVEVVMVLSPPLLAGRRKTSAR